MHWWLLLRVRERSSTVCIAYAIFVNISRWLDADARVEDWPLTSGRAAILVVALCKLLAFSPENITAA
jgi:hypothetical protein